MDTLAQDVRYAFRTLGRTPLLTGLAILCLALGIGANASMFSVVESTLVQPLPFREPDRLVDAWSVRPSDGQRSGTSYPDFLDWQRETRSFETLAAVQSRSLTLTGSEDPERVQGAAISAGLFTMLGIAPVLGRDIAAANDVPGAAPVILLTDQLWRRRYHANAALVGQAIDVDGRPHTVIGVLPPKVNFPFLQVAYVALAPVAHDNSRTERDLELFGRLAPGVGLAQAHAELGALATRLSGLHAEDQGWGVRVRPLRDYFAPDEVKLVTLAALGAVTLVLLIACANVANLLLARATSRAREMSLRAALGAPRGRLARQLLTEAIVLGLISVPIGVALTYVGIALVTAGVRADDVPYLIQFRVSGITLAYTVAVAAASSLVFGLAPAWQLSRVDLIGALREGGRTGGGGARTRGRNLLVVVEVALALVLLVGASLFVRSFLNMQLASAGFDPSPVLTLRVFLPGQRYESADAKTQRIEDILRRIERLPAVRAAGASNLIPLDGGGTESRVVVDGVPSEAGREPSVFFAGVTRRFFETLDIPLIRGRGFSDAESRLASPVAIVNVSFARRFLDRSSTRIPPVSSEPAPGAPALGGAAELGTIDAIGRRVQLLGIESAPWLTIVGVVPDFMVDEIDDITPGQPAVFAAYPHQATPNTGIIVRTAGVGAPADLTTAIRAVIRESDPGVPVFAVASLVEVRGKGLWQYKLFSWMFSIFGGLALLLGSAGVYGVLSYAVSQRTRELGVRIALGANTRDVLRLTVGQGLRLVAIGVGVGVLGAAGVTRVIGSLLYNVEPTDPVSFIAVIALLAGVGLLASYLPARRASRIDPVVALRND